MQERQYARRLLSAQILFCGIVIVGPWADQYFLIQSMQLPVFLKYISEIVFAVSATIFLLSLINLGKSLTADPVPKESSVLVTTGLYSFSRHPIYLALISMALAWAAIHFSLVSFLSSVALIFVLNKKLTFEERLLLQRYGKNYEDYMQSVNRFLPIKWIWKLKF